MGSAYNKCIEESPITFINAGEVGKYILQKCLQKNGERLSNLKLQMLLYYSQAFHLAVYDDPLFGDQILACTHAPVIPAVFGEYERYGAEPIDQIPTGPDLHPSITEHVDEVLEAYGHLSALALGKLAQSERPWLEARVRFAADATLEPTIDHASMRDYYRTQLLSDVPADSAFDA